MRSKRVLALLGIPIVIVLAFSLFQDAGGQGSPASAAFDWISQTFPASSVQSQNVGREDLVPVFQPEATNVDKADLGDGKVALRIYEYDKYAADQTGVLRNKTDLVSLDIDADFKITATDLERGGGIVFDTYVRSNGTDTLYSDWAKKAEINLGKTQSDEKYAHKFGVSYTKTPDFDAIVWKTSDPVSVDNVSKEVTRGDIMVAFNDLLDLSYTVDISQDKGVTSVVCGNLTGKSNCDPLVTFGNESIGASTINDTFVTEVGPTDLHGTDNEVIPHGANEVDQEKRGYMKINFTNFVPDGATITNFTLYMTQRNAGLGPAEAFNITDTEVAKKWREYGAGEVSWANQPCGTTTPIGANGSCASTAFETYDGANGAGNARSLNLTALAVAAVTIPNASGGKYISFAVNCTVSQGCADNGGTHSKDETTQSKRPWLYVEYTAPSVDNPPAFTAGSNHTYQGTVLEDDNAFVWADGTKVNLEVRVTDVDGNLANATMEMDGVNYTASNSSSIFYYNFSSRAGGSHAMKWYATDLNNNQVSLATGTLTVSTKTMSNVLKYIDGVPADKTVTTVDLVTLSGNTSTTTTEGSLPYFQLYTNSTLRANTTGAASHTGSFAEGSYQVILNSSGNQNFTSFDNQSIYLYVGPSGIAFDLANMVFPSNTTWRADVNRSWLVNVTAAVPELVYTYFCHNQSGSEVCTLMNPAYVRPINSTTNESYYWINDMSGGSYRWRWSADDQNSTSTANYTGLLIVSPTANNVSLSVLPSTTVLPTTTLNVTGTEDAATGLSLTRDSVTVSNPYVAVLGQGTYTFVLTSTATENFTSATASQVVTVNTEGLGCTTPTTFSFQVNVTSNGSTTALDFTDQVNQKVVKPDLSDVFLNTTVQPNASAARNQTSGSYYLVVNSTNVTWFSVEYSNYLGAQAWANTTVNQNVTAFNGTQIKPSYTFTISEETTSISQLPPNSNRTMTIFCASGIRSFQVNDTKFTVAAVERPTNFRMKVDYGPSDSYNRYLIPAADTESRTFYLVDAEANQVAQAVLTLDDRTVARSFANGTIVTIKKILHDGLQTVTQNSFDVDSKAAVFVIPNDVYSLTVDNGANSRTVGNLEIETTDLTKTIVVADLGTFDYNSANFSYSINMSDAGLIVFRWLDNSSMTTGVNFTVKNYTSGATLYDDYSAASDVSFVYNTTDPNQTYQVTFHVASPTVGSESFGLSVLLGGSVGSLIPLLGSIINPAYISAGVMMFLVFVGGLFGARHSATGVIIVLVLASMFLAFGWITLGTNSLQNTWIGAGIIAFLMFFAVIGAIVHKRRTDAE